MRPVSFRVNIRFDARTGRFEEFLVQSLGEPDADGTHDDAHEALAALLGSQIEVGAQVTEVFPSRLDPNADQAAVRRPAGAEAQGEDAGREQREGGETA